MKKLLSRLVLVTALVLVISPAAFAQKNVASPVSSGRPATIGLGLASFSGASLTGAPALSGWFDLDGKNMIQPLFSISSTSPGFGFSIGALYKHYMNPGTTGWHLGGGFSLGTAGAAVNNPFSVVISGVFGVHTAFPGTSDLLLQFDAGPAFRLDDGNANFVISPFSALLGASLIYVL